MKTASTISIDLGGLQQDHRKAKAALAAAQATWTAAARKVELACAAADRARAKVDEQKSNVEKARVAMLEGARTAANN